MNKNTTKKQVKISKIETTNDVISARGGLTLFLRYLENTKVFDLIEGHLGKVKGTKKGITTREFLMQFMLFIMDGSHRFLSYFDQLSSDAAYAAILETSQDRLASSHQIKRFFRNLSQIKDVTKLFRAILWELFLWRLEQEQPRHIILGIDTMVLDNDDAQKREGVEFTYKKKKGFQPLHLIWDSFLVDIIFRTGSAHSNHGNDFIESVSRIVNLIRERYSSEVPIILVGDSGFFDQKAFEYFEEELKIHYVITGKFYSDLWDQINQMPKELFKSYEQQNGYWKYIEFGWRYASWSKMRRAVFTTLVADESGQTKLDFACTNSIILTNIGMDGALNQQLEFTGIGHLMDIEKVIGLNHSRGKDELVHRSLKELATKEQLPFKNFVMNGVFYYLEAITHLMFESYKRDITNDVISISSYPNTFRRKLIDFAVKIVDHANQKTMKVREFIMNSLKLDELWKRCQSPPVINFA